MAPATPAQFALLAFAACSRVNATVCGVLFLFAFIYGSVVTCVVRASEHPHRASKQSSLWRVTVQYRALSC